MKLLNIIEIMMNMTYVTLFMIISYLTKGRIFENYQFYHLSLRIMKLLLYLVIIKLCGIGIIETKIHILAVIFIYFESFLLIIIAFEMIKSIYLGWKIIKQIRDEDRIVS